eukprot:CAMPEP_0203754732 /NCGR_PEP_ID=MMETSP0098-20131031/8306_1 /ASSEMBLY_ACC=CAM_ASM_000208 /TAXON_ID=96639 /ORGANISM=" , Strain NY0313808BC1" /LENGTH=526 /DNA_ID=CAMNT_0050645901 /DNA_START=137 /DNA_END=1714 /DNA_ORIENTATION=+
MSGVQIDAIVSKRSYFAGDVVKCRIYINFPESLRGKVLLEWATVQLHGHVAFDPHLVSPHDAAEVAEEAAAGFDPAARARRLRHAQESSILHRAEDSMQVLRKTGSAIQVGKANLGEMGRNSSFTEVNLTSLEGYEDIQGFLAQSDLYLNQSMPDVTLLAGKYGNCLFASPTEVVTCAFEGKPGRELVFAYEARLPDSIPPSYKGSAARYFYVLSIGAKLGHRKSANILHVPIRVCSSIGIGGGEFDSSNGTNGSRLRSFSSFILEDHDFGVQSWILGERSFRKRGTGQRTENFMAAASNIPLSVNPEDQTFRVVDNDCTGQMLKERSNSLLGGLGLGVGGEEDTAYVKRWHNKAGRRNTTRHQEQIFKIGSESKHMAHLHMYKDEVCPGEQLLLAFDLSNALTQCYQITVALEVQEMSKCPPPLQVAFDPLTSFDEKNVKNNSHESAHAFGVGPWTRILVSKSVQVAFNLTRHILLNIPVDATPDFETDLIFVQSFLRFEFVTAKEPSEKTSFPITNSDTQTSPW